MFRTEKYVCFICKSKPKSNKINKRIFFKFLGYSAAALLAIVFALPFAIGMIAHKDSGIWRHFGQAFYSAHLELFLGNACIGNTTRLSYLPATIFSHFLYRNWRYDATSSHYWTICLSMSSWFCSPGNGTTAVSWVVCLYRKELSHDFT